MLKGRKILAVILTLCMMAGMVMEPNRAQKVQASVKECGAGYMYWVSEDGLNICGYYGGKSVVEIPSQIGGKKVTYIGEFAFDNDDILTEVTIPFSVNGIWSGGFMGCTNLTEIRVAEDNPNLTSEDGVLFNKDKTVLIRCPEGKSGIYTVPSSVTAIEAGAFGNSKLTEINIPSSVIHMDRYVFHDCKNLMAINVDDDNTQFSTNDGVLYNKDQTGLITCPAGKQGSCMISSSVDAISDDAFNSCENFVSIHVDSGNLKYSSEDGVLFSKDGKDLLVYPQGRKGDYRVPDGVSDVRSVRGSQLTEITISSSVTEIGSFNQCENLTAIHVENGNLNYSSNNGVLYNKDQTELLRCPMGKSGTYNIPIGVVDVKTHAFEGCAHLTEIIIPASVTHVAAFIDCTSLTAIYVDSENSEFCSDQGILYDKNKTKLIRCPRSKEGVYAIPSGVIEMEGGAFYECSNLTEVIIPSSMARMDTDMFKHCKNLKAIRVDDANMNYSSDNGILFNKDKTNLIVYPEGMEIEEYKLPASVAHIEDNAFEGCMNLKKVVIPGSMTEIGSWVFNNCRKLSEIVLPDSITKIKISVFQNCSNLKSIYYTGTEEQWKEIEIVHDLIAIGRENAALFEADIYYNTEVVSDDLPKEFDFRILDDDTIQIIKYNGASASVNIPSEINEKSVTSIGERAFDSLSGLTKITISSSVTEIKDAAFNNCSNLKDVYYLGNRLQWDGIKIGIANDPLLRAVVHFNDGTILDGSEENTEDFQVNVLDTRRELEKLVTGDPFDIKQDMQNYLSTEQIDIMESYLYTWLAEINYAYSYSGSVSVKERIMKKAGIDPQGDFVSGKEQAVTHICVETKYGSKTFEVTLDLGKPDDNGNLYPSYSIMNYEILEKASIPSDLPTSGQIGRESYADLGTFAECVRKASEDSLHGTYQWESLDEEMTAGVLVDKTVTEIIGNKNGSFSDAVFIIYAKPLFTYSKKVTIACPVDVHVYSMDGKEAGSIVGNKPEGGNANVRLDVNGDTKTVYLAGNDYYLNLYGTDTGTMRYEVEEIANEEVRRNVQFLELQLEKDMQYEGYVFRPLNIDRDLYALRTVGGSEQKVFHADQDTYQALFRRIQSLSLSQGQTSLDRDKTVQLQASLFPLDASNPNLRWRTDNDSIIKVDNNGLVTAVGAGRATVTVSTKDGSFLKQCCVIDVADKTDSFGGSGNSSGWYGGGTSAPVEQERNPVVVNLHYVLQFQTNGGTNLSRKTMTLLKDDIPGIMPKVQREGYLFDGWYTQQDGGEQVTGDKPLKEATTLYARWTEAEAPAKPAAPVLKSKKKGQMQVSFKNVTGAAGYQIEYAADKKFASAKTKEAGTSAKTKTISGLKAGKNYYVRVRAYRFDSMKNKIYGAYSSIKSIKVKS